MKGDKVLQAARIVEDSSTLTRTRDYKLVYVLSTFE